MKPTEQNPKTVCLDCKYAKHIETPKGPKQLLYTMHCTHPARGLSERRHYVTGAPTWFDERWETPKENPAPFLLCKDENNGNCSLFEPTAEDEAEAA